ncbi:glycoside hydrolase family 3 protein [Laccaria bicolor S238N-H82]|uniref:beta-glucosidase n=1 Tax=Laccaria bicolor (strain S238N-H82 / ATCC MYA-4686) TaxID=486041 RepID=B0D734_LACBS|nr:glycoside hydrolase family 3 protein [Laccaria bicolor S238N-H82]EDR09330.1 glycoside hydrolase family 3 protein [Laccaria bicolor S238N-H82]|eukprot:XP_001879679.1 glycoside hydrolase family 3 protein [Laccaria bicolor S238N-H82]
MIPDFGPAWATAYEKAKAKLAGFTLEEKVNVTTGVGWANGRCVGNIPPVEPTQGRGWPGLCLEDSPLGVRFGDFVTAFPTGVNAAASFNRRLIRLRGLFMGLEHKGKGVNIALGPMMNMGRVAQGGRNWEGFGADPYLTGEAAYETILGMQMGGVQACAKHLINKHQEHFRTQESSDVDDRTQHEIYAHPFLRSVMAGVTSLMCSYNLINGTYACENDKMLNDIVKREFGFQGFIMSDWAATHSTISVMTGLDMTMPGDITFDSGTSYFGDNLIAYIQNGTIPESRLDDMATRILAAWYFLHQDAPSYPPTNFDAFRPDNETTNEHIDVQDDHHWLVRELGAASTVLLKNVGGALPLGKKDRSIVLVGSDAGPGSIGPNEFADRGGSDGILAMGWGSGTANFTYLVSPLEAIQRKAREFRTSVSWILDDFNLALAGNMARKRSAALVFISSDSGEGYITVDGNEGDRKNLTAWHGGDDLVLAVAAQNNNTIVVVNSVGPLIIEPWIDHPNVTAVVWAGLQGNEAGNSLVDVLYGDWNPSGRLPYTIAKNIADYPAQLITGGEGQDILDIPYSEALEIDYRHFDAKNITPRFEFGFGLSYTTFKYSGLSISKIESPVNDALIDNWENGGATPIEEGSSRAAWLHEPAFSVSFTVHNAGSSFGGDIPQLYVNFPASAGEPPSVLRGFTDVEVAPYEREKVTIILSRYDLSIWDTEAQGWRKPKGTIHLSVGASSRDIRLRGKIPAE